MSLSQTIVLILCGCGPTGGKVYTGSQHIQTAGGILSSYEDSTFHSFHSPRTHFLFLRSQRRWGRGLESHGCNAEINCHKSPTSVRPTNHMSDLCVTGWEPLKGCRNIVQLVLFNQANSEQMMGTPLTLSILCCSLFYRTLN